ncbi:hypothetical protein M408DRAFT_26941 [Serendipita vermifera MAFF 305830]|uniref:Uncharacterized protein n=1 Tax=Serendipita vermifera MAFF 305830 TaxID=933852 RepID=A0A0C3AYY0_SERVB|nr:hypothetical protein M408DRAFT_26941 [Serendipita vermifera MAFF 305830]
MNLKNYRIQGCLGVHMGCDAEYSAQGTSQALSKLAKSKPVYVAVGDVHSLPYADEVGL